jgi:hypothetical protein
VGPKADIDAVVKRKIPSLPLPEIRLRNHVSTPVFSRSVTCSLEQFTSYWTDGIKASENANV